MTTTTSGHCALIDDIQFPLELLGAIERLVPMQMAKLSTVGAAQLTALSECSFLAVLLAVDRS